LFITLVVPNHERRSNMKILDLKTLGFFLKGFSGDVLN